MKKIQKKHVQILGLISAFILAFIVPVTITNNQKSNLRTAPGCPGVCESIGVPIACSRNNPVHDSLGDASCKSVMHADNTFCCLRQNGNQCGNCKAGKSCSLANQYCESQISCAGLDMAENNIYRCDAKTKKWVFKYVQAGGTCAAKNCGVQCNTCDTKAFCTFPGQYCEKQASCSGTSPIKQVFQCQQNHKWKFLYPQKGGTCYSKCYLTPTPKPNLLETATPTETPPKT